MEHERAKNMNVKSSSYLRKKEKDKKPMTALRPLRRNEGDTLCGDAGERKGSFDCYSPVNIDIII